MMFILQQTFHLLKIIGWNISLQQAFRLTNTGIYQQVRAVGHTSHTIQAFVIAHVKAASVDF